jgi:hypothetical protein
MAETAAAELVLIERAARERWSPQELRLALICAAPMLTVTEIERVVAAIVAASVRQGGARR